MTLRVPEFLHDEYVDYELDAELKALLSLCFADTTFKKQRFNYEMPQYRWLIRTQEGQLAAHIAVHDKVLGSTAGDLRITGIAEVCVHPDWRGRKLVTALLDEIHQWAHRQKSFDFSVLLGNPKVYVPSGYKNATNPIRRLSKPNNEIVSTTMNEFLFLSYGTQTWPDGEIDLRGPTF